MQINNQQAPPLQGSDIRNNLPSQEIYQIKNYSSVKSRCEKFSEFFTGKGNITISVFIILMLSFLNLIANLIYCENGYYLYQSFGNFIFAIYIWSKFAMKIEKSFSSVKYFIQFLINFFILSIITFNPLFSLQGLWSFILFETILILNTNKTKLFKLGSSEITYKKLLIYSIIYSFFFNFFSVIIVLVYYLIYKKWLIKIFSFSDEKMKCIENCCIFRILKNNLTTFISMQDVSEHAQQRQNQMVNNQNENNSNISYLNVYPNQSNQKNIQQNSQISQVSSMQSVDNQANL